MGILKRVEDNTDGRRAFIELSDSAVTGMTRFFAEAGNDPNAVL
jgi:hypothetical protein